MDNESANAGEVQVLESGKKLSECILWRLQEEYYANLGLSAWDSIPYYPTSNPIIAEVYAELIVNFLLDFQDSLDWDEPLYILEMATGSGAFSFYLLRELERKLAYFSALKPLKLRYVMTDFADSIVEGWLQNERLQPFVESGFLDFAVFRPEEQQEIRLYRSGDVLKSGTVKNPIIGIANYFFDSIRQDQFRVENHCLQETRMTFTRRLGKDLTAKSSVQLCQLEKTESYVTIDEPPYASEELNRVLAHYADIFENASILFPIGGFNCIENLLALSNYKLVMLVADKGFVDAGYMRGHKEQLYTEHDGAFSYMVNFNALLQYFSQQNGLALVDHGDTAIVSLLMGVLLPEPLSLERIRHYFEENVTRRDVVNGTNLARRLVNPERYDALTRLRAAMSLIQLGNYDPLLLYDCSDVILSGIEESFYVTDYRNLLRTLQGVRENIFIADANLNVYNKLEAIYLKLRHFETCRAVARESLARHGDSSVSYAHLGASYAAEGQPDTALEHFRKAAALDPQNPGVQAALARLQQKIIPS